MILWTYLLPQAERWRLLMSSLHIVEEDVSL
jgi:hypothetical protein